MDSPSSVPRLGAAVGGGLWHRLKVDRVMVLIRCLTCRNSYVRQVTEAAVFLEAQIVGALDGLNVIITDAAKTK